MPPKRPGKPISASDKRRKRAVLTISEKISLLKKLDAGTSVSKLCEMYGVGSSTVYDLKKQKTKLREFYASSDTQKGMEVRKTMRHGKSEDLEKALMQWFRQRRNGGMKISGELVIAQAKLFHEELKLEHECNYSEGWLHKFKKRHGLSAAAVCGEKKSADHEAAAAYVDKFAKFVKDENLSTEQVYNADETALYWRCMPKKTLVTEDEVNPTGLKEPKDRVTIMGCSNAAGTHRLKLLMIGKSFRPRALKGVKIYPVVYRASKRGWMTTKIMLEWFNNYFVPDARAHCTKAGLDPKCKIVLLLDNCSAHPDAEKLVKDNVYAMYLPPNCTSLIQPQDQGILRSLKCHYRNLFMRTMLPAVNAGATVEEFTKQFTIKDLMWTVARAWTNVTSSTLTKCWHKLWPGLLFDDAELNDLVADFTGFCVSEHKRHANELMEYAKGFSNSLTKLLDPDDLEEWMHVDDDAPVVPILTTEEIVNMVLNPNQQDEENSEEEDEDVQKERVSIDKCLELGSVYIEALEQLSFLSDHDIMLIYNLQAKILHEKPNYMKQATLEDFFKKRTNDTQPPSSLDNPQPSTSSAPDIIEPGQ